MTQLLMVPLSTKSSFSPLVQNLVAVVDSKVS